MGKQKENFESLQAELAGAKENFDLKKFAEKVLAALGKSEEDIAAALKALSEAGQLNGDIQIKLDNETTLLLAANKQIGVLQIEADKVPGLLEDLKKSQQANSQLQSELDEALDELTSLGKQLHAHQSGADKPGILVEIDDELHRLHGNSFSIRGHEGKLTANELLQKPDLLKQMKESGSGALVPEESN